MGTYPVFLSVVVVVRNRADDLENQLRRIADAVDPLVTDYEIVVVENASEDESVARLRELTAEDGLANLQAYCLVKPVDHDMAVWVGLENALGDFSVVIDPYAEDPTFIEQMLDRASEGADVVFVRNEARQREPRGYRTAAAIFNRVYRSFSGVDLRRDAPPYRLLSRRVVNFILQHAHPGRAYRHLPATGGFTRANLEYRATPAERTRPAPRGNLDRGAYLLASSTRLPLRVATSLSLFGAIANVAYSIYVAVVWFTQEGVEPGWASMSLQLSGMFFLISLVLFVLGEYILHVAALSSDAPDSHVSQEFTSARLTRRERLNVEGSDAREGAAGRRSGARRGKK